METGAKLGLMVRVARSAVTVEQLQPGDVANKTSLTLPLKVLMSEAACPCRFNSAALPR